MFGGGTPAEGYSERLRWKFGRFKSVGGVFGHSHFFLLIDSSPSKSHFPLITYFCVQIFDYEAPMHVFYRLAAVVLQS